MASIEVKSEIYHWLRAPKTFSIKGGYGDKNLSETIPQNHYIDMARFSNFNFDKHETIMVGLPTWNLNLIGGKLETMSNQSCIKWKACICIAFIPLLISKF